jgi:hypothetical protein
LDRCARRLGANEGDRDGDEATASRTSGRSAFRDRAGRVVRWRGLNSAVLFTARTHAHNAVRGGRSLASASELSLHRRDWCFARLATAPTTSPNVANRRLTGAEPDFRNHESGGVSATVARPLSASASRWPVPRAAVTARHPGGRRSGSPPRAHVATRYWTRLVRRPGAVVLSNPFLRSNSDAQRDLFDGRVARRVRCRP